MKAAVHHQYGPPEVVKLEEIETPVPRMNEVLIKIHASTVTAGDCELRKFDMPAWIWLPLRLYMGFFKPRIKVLGQELSGVIESVGKEVTQYKPGDRVFAPTEMRLGGHAEYICLPVKKAISKIPDNIGFHQAATIPTGGLNALCFIRKGNIRPGEKVLINGAGGSIGTYAIQLAKSLKADVTAVDSTKKLDLLRSIGADHVIDYTKEDFTQNSQSYDVIIDVVGESPFARSIRSLNPNGRLVIGNPYFSGIIRGIWFSMINRTKSSGNGKKVIQAVAPYQQQDLEYLGELIRTGDLIPVIDKIFKLDDMADAHRYVEAGLKKGHVVISMA